MKIAKWILLGVGLWAMTRMIGDVGWGTIFSNVAGLGWNLLWLFAIYPFVFALNSLGWWYAFPTPLSRKTPFLDFCLVRVIGETFNNVIPGGASLGGEPVKAELLKKRHGVPRAQTYASLLIVHTTFWLSLNAFLAGALAFTYRQIPPGSVLWQWVFYFFAALGIGGVLLIWILLRGVFRKVADLGRNFSSWKHYWEEKNERFLKLDDDIRKFYTRSPGRLFLSTLFNLASWCAGIFEVLIFSGLLGMEIRWTEAWLLEALIQSLRIVTFFIPSSVGAQEGGILLVFSQMGFAAPLALTFAVLRRIREILWNAVGLLLWVFFDRI
ncbi:MAG: flippase-like domain-containing protein [Candidatus Omnitrophica bacterium]|nr:flippase-like domain-containing protein [Candidatus Omnitrophota bacterium]